ncbi:MAG: insulinase family protein [Vicinamibacteria bacterium]|nr:insulinase family protein [Vicinamibacteria bacterium]
MRVRSAALAALLAVTALPAGAAAGKPEIAVEEVTLDNGMKWLLFPRADAPTVAAGWVARVGSVNERPGITGISHFFEHMMFKGTRTLGTKDLARDLELIEEQEKVQAEMRAEREAMRERLRRGEIADLAAPESRSPRYKELEARFDALVQEQRALILKDPMDELYTKHGGEGLNASTSEDWTIYFVRVPKNKLELWAWLESDRLAEPVFREFYSERDVVFEERRLRTESTPLGRYEEALNSVFWEAHPYKWPVVGWASDIPEYTLAQAKDYFATWYAPNNLTGVLVGDFQPAAAKALIERYFGRLARGTVAPPPVVTLEPKQLGEKRYQASAETSPTVRLLYHGVPFVHRDAAALDLLTDVLSGRTGRLYKGLVEGRKLANEARASSDFKKHAGLVQVEAVVKDGQDPAAVEKALGEEIERLQKEPVAAEELQKVKNQAKAGAYRRLSSPFFIAIQLLVYEGLGDWRYINTSADAWEAVTAEDIQRVARDYLVPEKRTVAVFLRKDGTAPEDPALAALPPQAKAMVKQSLARIEAETDPAKLQEGLARMQAMAAQVPAEIKPGLEYVIAKTEERLKALEGEKK